MESLNDTLPLFSFFERLRKNEFPLGIGDYEKLLKALSNNFGIGITEYKAILDELSSNDALFDGSSAYPKKSLLRICKLIWLKPGQSTQLFEDIFSETYLLDYQIRQNTKGNFSNTKDEEKKTTDKTGIIKGSEEDQKLVTGNNLQDGKKNTPGETQDTTIQNKKVFVRVGVGENTTDDFRLEGNKEVEKSKFLFTNNYFPLDDRKIQQNIRAFPSFRRVINSLEMDVEATINKMIEKGFFNDIVFKKSKKSISSLLLLIDHEGSMVAFNQLSEKIRKELEKVLLPKVKIANPALLTFYFYNVWGDYLFENKTHTKYKELDKETRSLKNKQANIIIISDAGAAKGTYNRKRVDATASLLLELKDCTSKIAWLNPMPTERWKNTSAEVISKIIAMFEANETGIKNAVRFLKGSTAKVIKL